MRPTRPGSSVPDASQASEASRKRPATGAILGLQRTAGNRATAQLLRPAETVTVQRRWLLVDDAEKSYRFWDPQGDDKASTPVPAPWAKYPEAAPPGKYAVDTGAGGRLPRGQVVALTFEVWSRIHAASTRATSSDVYNPYGRFVSDGGLTSFVPESAFVPADKWKQVALHLAEKDKNFREPSTYSTETTQGFPQAVFTKDGERLALTNITPLGAVYSQKPPPDARAVADRSKVTDPSVLGLNLGGAVTIPGTANAPAMIGKNSAIDESLLTAYHGKDREKSQLGVMGASAGDAAASAGFDRDQGDGWEWLHMIAHSMGGLEVIGPQNAGNLVAGTSECNAHMIVVEEMIKKVVATKGVRARLWVAVQMYDTARQIGERIEYHFVLGDGENARVFRYQFDCLTRTPPLVFLNRNSRYLGEALFESEKGAKPPAPATNDSTASDLADNLVNMVLGNFPADEVVADLRQLGKVPAETFYLLGACIGDSPEALVPQYVPGLLSLLVGTDYGHGLVPFFRGLLKGVGPDVVHGLLDKLVIPAFGGAAKVPAELVDQFARALRARVGPDDADKWMTALGMAQGDRQRIEHETTRSGDCLYEGVTIALGNPIGSHDVLRRLATNFIVEHRALPAIAGLSPDAVVHTLVTPGAWNGPSGDLAPIVLASVINRRINVVVPGDVVHTIDPRGIDPTARLLGHDITLYLRGGHYTVRKSW